MRYRSERNDRYTGYALATVNSVFHVQSKIDSFIIPRLQCHPDCRTSLMC